MKENETIDVSNSLAYREGWEGERYEENTRSERIVYLSELPDGTLAGTEKMTRSEYAVKQKRMRMALREKAEGLFFAESAPAVAYRAKVGMIRTERQYGSIWVVWEEVGPRMESKKEPVRKKGRKKDAS